MSMTHEEAIQLLSSMFESYERDTLMAVFESNGYHVERTIESIIGMEQPELATSTPSQQTQQTRNDYGGGSQSQSRSANAIGNDFGEPVTLPPLDRNMSSSTSNKHRGAPVQLPEDFLRIPKRPVDQLFLEDEQLALMLQNELFKEHVEQQLGNEFRDGLRQHQRQSHNTRSQQRGSAQGQGDSSGDIMGIPDMGILTGLKGMGEGMKKQLNQLALNFNSKNKGSASSRSSRLDEESRPLTSQDYEEEEDEEDDYAGYGNSSNSSSLRSRGGNKKDN